ncbi:WcbI family polysaccharide biosynthesis putative acetyltransferase [Sphingomonas arantia]|uniref:WcbI family polysaccharide biosynthesis putative acetyltransferase n=1 Tax=Sphingomonas arantia TaxID=1460676 RepID=A0ABW4U112_9SPHN
MSAAERWILISNCQTYGLAHCLQMLADGIVVEPVDMGQYQAHVGHYNAGFGDYDRVLIGLGAEAVPGADFSAARRVDKVPELVFTAYHPDLAYIMDGAAIVEGPIGAYHSLIAFVAHGAGRSVDDTLPLFDAATYAASGYLDCWGPARDNLVWYCNHLNFDVADAVRRWGRSGAFMYSTNHPRIHVLHDIARIYLEREGYATRVSDVMPHDNLVMSGVFPVYPEIGEALGVPGSYLFKRINAYTQIGLRQFIEESFAVYDRHAPGTLAVHEQSRASHDRVAAVLQDVAVAA